MSPSLTSFPGRSMKFTIPTTHGRGDEVSAVFDWEMTGVGDPLTDIGWAELLWMQPVGLTSHEAALSIDEFVERYEARSGIKTQNRGWYRALNAYKMAVICLIGSMLFESGDSDDQRFLLNAHGITPLTQMGRAELAIDEKLADGPVMPRNL